MFYFWLFHYLYLQERHSAGGIPLRSVDRASTLLGLDHSEPNWNKKRHNNDSSLPFVFLSTICCLAVSQCCIYFRVIQSNILCLPIWDLNIKRYIKHSTTILPVILYASQTWYLTQREEQRLRVFKNSVLRQMFWTNGSNSRQEEMHSEELHGWYSLPNTTGAPSQGEWDGLGKWHIWRRGSIHLGFLRGNLKDRDYMEGSGV